MFSVFGRNQYANQHSDGGSVDMNGTAEVSRESCSTVSGISAWCVVITCVYLMITTTHMSLEFAIRHIFAETSPATTPAQRPLTQNKAVFRSVEEDAPLESVPERDAFR